MLRKFILLLALASPWLGAAETPASEASIREILTVTEVRQLIERTFSQMEARMLPSLQQAVGRALTTEEREILAQFATRTLSDMRAEMSWDKMEALYIRIYQKSFSQSEVDGMLTFYKSPAGQALVRKMPQVMQESMTAMQEQMGPLLQKLQRSMQEMAAEIRQRG